MVAPLAGAWIEICSTDAVSMRGCVAPLAGAWIEMHYTSQAPSPLWSLPSRERGLKYFDSYSQLVDALSLPSRERGLKSLLEYNIIRNYLRRSPRGSVD